jgi:hypothetical protein
MRMMLKVLIPTDAGNDAVKDGSLAKLFGETIRKLNAEASYFVAQDGLRCALIFFDMKEPRRPEVGLTTGRSTDSR